MKSKRRKNWEPRRGVVLEGKPLHQPAPARVKYTKAIESLIKPMVAAYEKAMKRVLEPDRQQDASLDERLREVFADLDEEWAEMFATRSKEIVGVMVGRVEKASRTSVKASLEDLMKGMSISAPVAPTASSAVAITAKKAVTENVDLIKTIQKQYHSKIRSAVTESVGPDGEGAHTIFKKLQEIGGVEGRRAELIARDQTSKITTTMNAERATSAGMKKFKWRSSKAGKTHRQLHASYDGQIFSYDNLPVIDERTGERGLPGQAINCRCVAIPVIDFGDE